MRDLETLRSIGNEIVHDPDLEPKRDSAGVIVETHCNEGAERVAQAMGCDELNDLLADDQYDVMDDNVSKRWARVDGMTATAHALAGGLAFAAMTSTMLGELHGHIAAVAPEPMQWSGSLGKNVPMVFNVGKTNADEKESAAFPVADGECSYFIWD